MAYNKRSVYQNGALKAISDIRVGQSFRLYHGGYVSQKTYVIKSKGRVKTAIYDDYSGRFLKQVNNSYLVLPV